MEFQPHLNIFKNYGRIAIKQNKGDLVLSLGMSPLVAFPIMMGSCAFLMPVAGIKFIKEGAYDARVTLIITFFGILGVLVAAYLVKSLPLNMLTWVVMVAIFYTAVRLFGDSRKK